MSTALLSGSYTFVSLVPVACDIYAPCLRVCTSMRVHILRAQTTLGSVSYTDKHISYTDMHTYYTDKHILHPLPQPQNSGPGIASASLGSGYSQSAPIMIKADATTVEVMLCIC
ncbi:hypothetical protein C8R43DRAFT_27148 [Mycena crocata]|nr:hypothetical protein C8R43DRAFT_27148 [Mycena crocata]